MMQKRVLWIVVGVGVLILIMTIFVLVSQKSPDLSVEVGQGVAPGEKVVTPSQPNPEQPAPLPPPVPLEEYGDMAKVAISPLADAIDGNSSDEDVRAAASATKDGLMLLTVPGYARDVHLDIILSLSKLEQAALDGDDAAFANSKEELEKILSNFPPK